MEIDLNDENVEVKVHQFSTVEEIVSFIIKNTGLALDHGDLNKLNQVLA